MDAGLNLPPGFEMDAPSPSAASPAPSATPNVPPGFELDDQPSASPPQAQKLSLSDYATKIAPALLGKGGPLEPPWSKAAGAFPDMAGAGAEWLGKQGMNPNAAAAAMLPVSMFPSVLAGYSALPERAQGALNELPSFAGKVFRSEAGGVGGDLSASAGASPAPVLGKPNYLQQTGGAGLNAQAGIRGGTITKLARAGQNPGTVGINLAQELSDAGAIGKDPIETWDRVSGMLKNVGQQIGGDKQAIAQEAAKYGAVGNPLEMDAETALRPLANRIQEIGQNITGTGQDVAAKMQDIYDNMTNFAKANGGTLNIDHIDKALGEIGPLTSKGSPENMAMYRDIFHTIADTRDSMIQTLADQAQNPALRQNLLSHNALYSKLMRVMPDISKASGNAAVGQKRLIDMFNDLQQLIINRGGMSVGSNIPNPSQATAGFRLAQQAGPIIKGQQ